MEHKRLTMEELLDVIPHVFLPRRLPDSEQSNLILVEKNLLGLLQSSVSSSTSYFDVPKICPKTTRLFETWVKLQSLLDLSQVVYKNGTVDSAATIASKQISDAIASMEEKDVIALYIRAQNSGMILSVPTNPVDLEHVVLSTFQASSKSESVMSASGDLISTFPEASVRIPKSKILHSEEFAVQLRHLNNNTIDIAMAKSFKAGREFDEVRDVPDPILITDWAIPAASNKLSDDSPEFPTIMKKIRDDVIWTKAKNIPFRRSGLWMTAKVALQISIILEHGEEHGIIIYKLMMIRAMHMILMHFDECNNGDWDLKMQMMAKIARRLEKVKQRLSQFSDNNNNITVAIEIANKLIKKVTTDFQLIRGKMDRLWEEVNNSDKNFSNLALSFDQIKSDTGHVFQDLRSYLERRQKEDEVKSTNAGQTIAPPACPKRLKSNALPSLSFSSNDYHVDFELWDLEMWVRNHLDLYCVKEHSYFIRNLITEYSNKAVIHYQDDPVANSRLILTVLKCIMVLDKIAMNEHPILKKHKPGIDLKIVKKLLLPWKSEMQLADEIETYFQRRYVSATFPSLIDEAVPSSQAPSVIFARQCETMCELRRSILEIAECEIEDKKAEVRRVREECNLLRTQIGRLGCETWWNSYLECRQHSSSCTKCSLTRTRDSKLLSVTRYEKPLPRKEDFQYAVCFELLIPTTIACLRDMLHFFKVDMCNGLSFSEEQEKQHRQWITYNQISHYCINTSRIVSLGSTLKTVLESHYSQLSVDSDEDGFIVENGMNLLFHGEKLISSLKHWKQRCTFRINCSHKKCKLEDSQCKLQWAIEGTSHTPNEVLVNAHDCPIEVTIPEFKQFGMLRAGDRLQYRNIILAFVNGNLSIKNESVFQLLSQAQWEAGPSGEGFRRDSHMDFEEPSFSNESLNILESLVDANGKNWSEAYTLINLIMTCSRITELVADDEVRQKAAELLRKCRKITGGWIETISDLLAKAYKDPEEAKTELKAKLVDAALASALTFHVSKEFMGLVMRDSEDLLLWLKASSTLYDEIFWNTAGRIGSVSVVKRTLLRLSVNIGINLEDHILPIIVYGNGVVLNRFTRYRWKAAVSFNDSWVRCQFKCEQIFECDQVQSTDGTHHVVHIDVILGRFLVDGCPVGRVEEGIARHQEYERVFMKADFRVQPNLDRIFTTTSEYHGCNYSFQLKNANLLVHEEYATAAGRRKLELIPHALFQNQVPFYFVDNYSHWWNPSSNVIIFRPKSFEDPNFVKSEYYTLSLHDMKIQEIEVSPIRNLISMNSSSFTKLVSTLELIEPRKYIHIWSSVDSKSQPVVEVELARLCLKFKLVDLNTLESHEFPGMIISNDQSLGTLTGLKNKIVLIEQMDCKSLEPARKVIIPHGGILRKQELYHQSVEIDLEELRSPRFFAYEVTDHRFQILKAGRNHCAWFYLAALHAMTSSPLPDPFTKVTGTEMAFQILQSSRCWSTIPYDAESLTILNAISKLTPSRVYYPPNLQKMHVVTWPENLPSTAAHEGFFFIVQKLFQDSNRLDSLFTKHRSNINEDEDEDLENSKRTHKFSDERLNLRSYWRQEPLENEMSTIAKDFDPDLYNTRPCPIVDHGRGLIYQHPSEKINHIRIIADLGQTWKSHLEPEMVPRIRCLLIQNQELSGQSSTNPDKLSLIYFNVSEWLKLKLRDNWLDLYSLALTVTSKKLQVQWTLILSALAFSGTTLEDLLLLHAVAVNSEKFPGVPNYTEYLNPAEIFNRTSIDQIFSRNTVQFSEYSTGGIRKYSTEKECEVAKQLHLDEVEREVEKLTADVVNQWPTKCWTSRQYASKIIMDQATMDVNIKVKQWYCNLQLTNFIKEVEDSLLTLVEKIPSCKPEITVWTGMSPSQDFMKDLFQINFQKMMFSQKVEGFMEAHASLIFETGDIYSDIFLDDNCKLAFFTSTSNSIWTAILDRMTPPESLTLVASGLYPRLTPSTLLPLLMTGIAIETNGNIDAWESIKKSIGAVAVLWTLEQRLIRCLRYKMQGNLMEIALQRELETKGYENWSPKDHPGWLLLQLEMYMMIRPIQLKVAQEMMNPTSDKNTVMQLNMGEGKTSLIVPMLAISLADGEQLCRVTVIKSIFETNFNALRHTLGGLLNKRIYTVPCWRDLKMGINEIEVIQKAYEECLNKKGIVVTLPEYRLSFQLKGYERPRKAETESENGEIINRDDVKNPAMRFINVQKWLNTNCRDILDESDDILSVKYQLVYTVGQQLSIGGGGMRWVVCQNLLKLLPHRMKDLNDKYGDLAVEFDTNKTENPAEFPPCRLLQKDKYQELIDMIAENFLEGRMMSFPQIKQAERELIKKFLIADPYSMTKKEHDAALQIFKDDIKNKEIMIILSGYLKFEVLRVALEKRWRVNYGVNINGHRKMAVPFKAKDVASERTEFGHPDMAIILTQLSYYYSGLSDSQLEKCFDYLEHRHSNPDDEYASWIKSIPSENVDPSVRNYKGINLADYGQRTKLLFPMLRKIMAVIDFWLSNLVFPKESKQFPAKMTCTAWDLCSQNQKKLTTGFSGTNDSSNLLPLNISQNDLPELQDTNRKLEAVLLKEENDHYLGLPFGIRSKEIIQKLKDAGIKVLLDCGALMLELNNSEVAKAWLEIDQTIEAVIYFNSRNVETVKIRNGKDCPLELSPYRGGVNMNVCAVYLDDEHTRGTDLKFPTGSRACVTLGAGLTRDKMVQACMRMRLLGKGHTVTFWASQEANNKIRDVTGCGEISSKDVLQWVCHNSEEYQNEGLVYWTASAVNYCEKLTAESIFQMYENGNNGVIDELFRALKMLSEQCSQNEVTTLMEMYGHLRSEDIFLKIISSWFFSGKSSLIAKNHEGNLPENAIQLFKIVEQNVIARCEKFIPEKKHFSQLLDEEQEKELENELETEREVSRPPKAVPLKHSRADSVEMAIKVGDIQSNNWEGAMIPLPYAFQNTEVWKVIQEGSWGDSIFVTKDFSNSVKPEGFPLDEFLHSPVWIVSMETKGDIYLLIISAYEANVLINQFRRGAFNSTLHIYTPRCLLQQRILIRDQSLCLPALSNSESEFTEDLLAPLSLFAGTLYFADEDEQQAFGDFLGIIPRPRDEDQEEAFEMGFMSLNGFVNPDKRRFVRSLIKDGAFGTNPAELVKSILLVRHEGYITPNSHVAKLALDGLKSVTV